MEQYEKAGKSPTQEKFTKALASLLAASPAEVREEFAKTRDEKPSPQTRYIYDPEADRS